MRGVSGDAQSRPEQGPAGAEAGSDGMSRASIRTTNPAMSTALLGSEMPITVITVPASEIVGR